MDWIVVGGSGMVERIAKALEPKCRAFGGGEMPLMVSQEFARAAIEALALTEIVPLTHRDFENLSKHSVGRPSCFDGERWEDVAWPKPDSKYRLFVMATEFEEGKGDDRDGYADEKGD